MFLILALVAFFLLGALLAFAPEPEIDVLPDIRRDAGSRGRDAAERVPSDAVARDVSLADEADWNGAEAAEIADMPATDRIGKEDVSGEGATGDRGVEASDAEAGSPEAAPLIEDFDPAEDVLEIAYEGPSVPSLQVASEAGLTSILLDDVVVAQLAGAHTLGTSQIRLVAMR